MIPVAAGGGRAIKVVNLKMRREDSLMSKTFALAAGAVALCAITGTSNAQVQMQRDITWKLGLAIAEGAIEECAKSSDRWMFPTDAAEGSIRSRASQDTVQ